MYLDSKELPKLLDKLRQHNENLHERLNREYRLDAMAGYHQTLGPPDRIESGVPTLMAGEYVEASKMLQIRFDYASFWKDAVLGIKLLSIREMKDIWVDREIQQQIKTRASCWELSPPARLPWNKVALFGVNQLDSEEVYLVWSGRTEPEVVAYIGNYEERFESIADFILFFCQKDV